MATTYWPDLLLSRLLYDADRSVAGDDDADVTNWDTSAKFILATQIGLDGKNTDPSAYKLQWRDVTDSGSFADVASTGEIKWAATSAVLSDGTAVTSTTRRCTANADMVWADGLESVGDNACPDAGTFDLGTDEYSELQWALDPADAQSGHEYEFLLYNNSEGASVGTCACTLTMSSGTQTSDTRPARTEGYDTASDTRPARTEGYDTANDTRAARTEGQVTTSSERAARTEGYDTADSTRAARTKGSGLTLLDSYPIDNYSHDYNIGSSYWGVGQSFDVHILATLIKAVVYMKKYGSPEGTVAAKIYACENAFGGGDDKPTGSPLAVSNSLDVSTLTTSYVEQEFVFSGVNEIPLSLDTGYCLAFEYSNGDGSNFIRFASDGTSPTHDGNAFKTADLITWSADGDVYDLVFYVYGRPRVYDSRAARTEGQVTTSDSRAARTEGTITGTQVSDTRAARTEGYDTVDSTRAARTEGCVTTDDSRAARTEGTITGTQVSDTRAARTQGKVTDAIDTRAARTEGSATASSSRPARTEGCITVSDTRPARAEGKQTISSARPARVQGYDTADSTRAARTEGQQTISDTRAARTEGYISGTQVSDTRAARTKGKATTSSTRAARTEGQETVSDSRAARTEGRQTTQDTRAARSAGFDTAIDNRPARTEGQSTTESTRAARVEGCDTASSTRAARTEGTLPVWYENLTPHGTEHIHDNTGLLPDTLYAIRLYARNGEGDEAWAPSETGFYLVRTADAEGEGGGLEGTYEP